RSRSSRRSVVASYASWVTSTRGGSSAGGGAGRSCENGGHQVSYGGHPGRAGTNPGTDGRTDASPSASPDPSSTALLGAPGARAPFTPVFSTSSTTWANRIRFGRCAVYGKCNAVTVSPTIASAAQASAARP